MTAREEGKAAKAAGKEATDNPYDVDSKEYDDWWAGFSEPPAKKEPWWEKAGREADAAKARKTLEKGGLPKSLPPEVR